MNKIIVALILSTLCITISYAKLLVGTTGDYAPFSIYDENIKSFSGEDIQLIKDFAKFKGENVEFVKTTWKTAEQSLKDGLFDVFVGGVTITLERQKLFVFSNPLASFNKSAMSLCENVDKYKNYQDIDSPNTLIIENRGGTNEKFALQKVRNAKILIINDNKQAIKSITEGIDGIRPDIMFTDTVEIAYQHSINSKLCQIPVKVDNNISYKAFMFNKTEEGRELVKEFNQWLKEKRQV
ncbi:transporter substrate-binding domain-containing protein [Allofrancisella guangzhouensis]|uniref:Cyclohexadienyl dehydratase n=1 Tax=Allofrancisella guangzhouensis TaxID=594679 RepID=A0A0A8E936_9GAMM|nr:transporter substrate-binding domain-containing protein [Allofrancisella guangzhouensis]AJC48661.1 cyclohexadienyl dehydratase [Allofrancisella guangzhouensis]MBK2027492.1 transporter substrate-binding domain-containing protein [Allofrancisella guangzhouensis]MBK2044492.1 transporter substrate-binding domain-containing protein [Allofrancisella guangzhouensis]MBK2045413.1 transporter substrate-binding domain-containing protein [Allofrancisella guangzhouensis]